jgi:hypothetical protein
MSRGCIVRVSRCAQKGFACVVISDMSLEAGTVSGDLSVLIVPCRRCHSISPLFCRRTCHSRSARRVPCRAMRNRGVEIYLPGPQEEECSSLDLRSLLCDAGLRSHSLQDVLLSVHHVMSEMRQGECLLRQHAAHVVSDQCDAIML